MMIMITTRTTARMATSRDTHADIRKGSELPVMTAITTVTQIGARWMTTAATRSQTAPTANTRKAIAKATGRATTRATTRVAAPGAIMTATEITTGTAIMTAMATGSMARTLAAGTTTTTLPTAPATRMG